MMKVQVIEPAPKITSPNRHKLPQVQPGDPPMDMERIRAHRDKPTKDTERFAAQLIGTCGPLVLDGYQYRLDDRGKVKAVPVEYLGMDRQKLAEGIEKLELIDGGPASDE